jgi:hypothetical protein
MLYSYLHDQYSRCLRTETFVILVWNREGELAERLLHPPEADALASL